jgi:solute carrier family 35 protein
MNQLKQQDNVVKHTKHATENPATMVTAALLYGVTSILLVISNKICLTTYEFPDAVMLALSQCCCTMLVIIICSLLGVIKLNLSHDAFSRMLLLCIVNALNVGTGLIGTKSVTIPMYTALRRISIFLTMVGEAVVLKKVIKNETKWYVALMCGGAFLGAIYDLSFNFYGYISILISALCTALSGVLTKLNLNDNKLSKWDILVYNNLVALPLYVIGVYVRSSMSTLKTFKNWDSTGFLFYFSMSSVLGIFLQFTILYAVQVNGPLALTITGLLKNIITSYLGFVGIGGDYKFGWVNFIGINISMVGGVLFSRARYLNAVSKVKETSNTNSSTNENMILPHVSSNRRETVV